VAYDALLRVVEEEAAHEVERIRDGARRDRERILAEARAAAAAAREAVVARERAAGEARRRGSRERLALARERTLLVERRRLLSEVVATAWARLVNPPDARARAGPADGGHAGDELALLARLVAELLPELPEGPFELEVDPGAGPAARETLARLAPHAAARATVVEAATFRGGVRATCGRLELDDTLVARLERAWPVLEPELARRLFGEGGPP
jgi:vacuolar-type H+-ATPase subunit E/Vma4